MERQVQWGSQSEDDKPRELFQGGKSALKETSGAEGQTRQGRPTRHRVVWEGASEAGAS